MSAAILATSVVAWAAVHSWLASTGMKQRVGGLLGERMARGYRLVYNAFSFVSFLPILVLMRVLPEHALYSIPAPWIFVLLAGQLGAVLCLVLALLQTDSLHFVGLRQLTAQSRPSALTTRGFYALVRHPLYLFGLIFLWLTPIMSVNMLTVYIALSIYLFVGANFEERRLLSEFGAQYEAYRQRTPMIIPRLWSGRPAGTAAPRHTDR